MTYNLHLTVAVPEGLRLLLCFVVSFLIISARTVVIRGRCCLVWFVVSAVCCVAAYPACAQDTPASLHIAQPVTELARVDPGHSPANKAKVTSVQVTSPTLESLFKTESISALLNSSVDALRVSDVSAGYYVPAQTFGHLVPQLDGPRKWLENKGISLQLSYKGEGIANVAGGVRRGMDYAHEITLITRLDLGKLFDLSGWYFNAVMLERAGRQVSYDYVGEHRILLSEVYSLSGSVAAHLADMYLEKTFFHNRVNVHAGRITLTHTYATSVLLCTFIIQCSAPVGIKSQQGWSVYPKATWGGTVRVRPARDLVLITGVYQSSPLAENPSGWAWGAEHGTGVMLPVELTWQPFFGRRKLPGHYKVGFAHDTSPYADLIGTLPAALRNSMKVLKPRPRDTFYIEVDQMIYRKQGNHQMAGGYLMAGYIHNTPSVSVFSDQVYVGASLLGIIPYRPFDRFGVMYSYYKLSNRLSEGQRLRRDAGMSMGAFVNGPQTHTATLEVYYGIPVIPGLVAQPVFEYMFRPGETSRIPDAALLGLKVMATL
ncbi:carbohydrate porin [Acetobacter thailandicus]|uniref:carbohydrate porin n=1 Tax=Acetobacter thailandicus TaxID=1502842 RepID=UPI001BA74D60|nr:carbohydrate porin [Acetobacter thailandicus]MBS0979746.1 carbohydrate porin [Acetobacter thailandicus]